MLQRTRGKHLDRPWHLTYLRKQGNVTPAQKLAVRRHWHRYGQGLKLAHFRAQLEDLRECVAHVRAQLDHLRDTSTG
jgi:hypothetical protein